MDPTHNDALALLVGEWSSGFHHDCHRAGNITVVYQAIGPVKFGHGPVHIIAGRTQTQRHLLGPPGRARVMEMRESIAFMKS
jgi:hypothetical protein